MTDTHQSTTGPGPSHRSKSNMESNLAYCQPICEAIVSRILAGYPSSRCKDNVQLFPVSWTHLDFGKNVQTWLVLVGIEITSMVITRHRHPRETIFSKLHKVAHKLHYLCFRLYRKSMSPHMSRRLKIPLAQSWLRSGLICYKPLEFWETSVWMARIALDKRCMLAAYATLSLQSLRLQSLQLRKPFGQRTQAWKHKASTKHCIPCSVRSSFKGFYIEVSFELGLLRNPTLTKPYLILLR